MPFLATSILQPSPSRDSRSTCRLAVLSSTRRILAAAARFSTFAPDSVVMFAYSEKGGFLRVVTPAEAGVQGNSAKTRVTAFVGMAINERDT